MNMQAVAVRGVLIVAMSALLCVTVAHRAYTQPNIAAPAPTTVAHALASAPSAQPATVVLPTVSVRPSAADIAVALESEDDEVAASFIEAAQVVPPLRRTVSMPSLQLSMPYYSFGKVLTRVNKE